MNQAHQYKMLVSSFIVNFGKNDDVFGNATNALCSSPTPLPAFEGYVCIDDVEMGIRTSKTFNPEKTTEYRYKIWFSIVNKQTGETVMTYVVTIFIEKWCDAQSKALDSLSSCNPIISKLQRSGFTKEPAVEFELGLERKNKTPIMLTSIWLPGFEVPPNEYMFLNIKRGNGDVIYDKRITSLKDNKIVMNLVEMDKHTKYTARIRNSVGKTVKLPNDVTLRYFEMTNFCKTKIPCYSKVENWVKLMMKKSCGFDSPLWNYYSSCRGNSFLF